MMLSHAQVLVKELAFQNSHVLNTYRCVFKSTIQHPTILLKVIKLFLR